MLFIDEMHTLIGAGKGDGAMDASNLLKPALARGELHCVGATTLDEYRKHVEKDAALAPPLPARLHLRAHRRGYGLDPARAERRNTSSITACALPIRRSSRRRPLSNRYITDRFLPDKAIDLVDEAGARLRMQVDSKPEELDSIDREIILLPQDRGRSAEKRRPITASRDRLAPAREGTCRSRGAIRADHRALECREEQARRSGGAQAPPRRGPHRARPGPARGPVSARRRTRLRDHFPISRSNSPRPRLQRTPLPQMAP